MTSVTGTHVQLPPELQRLVDDVVSELMTAADPVVAAHQFVLLFDQCLTDVQGTEADR